MDVTRYKLGNEFTTAIIGLPKSASVIPVAATAHEHPPYYDHEWWWRNGIRHTLFTPSVCLVNGTVRAVHFLYLLINLI